MGERETCLTTELRAGIVTFLTSRHMHGNKSACLDGTDHFGRVQLLHRWQLPADNLFLLSAVAYILAVNAQILTDSGGPCTPDDCSGPLRGDPGCKFDPTNTGARHLSTWLLRRPCTRLGCT